MLSRISSRELSGWMAYERITGPLGQRRDDIHTAMIMAMIANTNRPKGKAPIPVEKFLPDWDHTRPQTDEDMWAAIRAANDAMGGTTTDGEKPRRRKFRSVT
jgi:hypothetical protein